MEDYRLGVEFCFDEDGEIVQVEVWASPDVKDTLVTPAMREKITEWCQWEPKHEEATPFLLLEVEVDAAMSG